MLYDTNGKTFQWQSGVADTIPILHFLVTIVILFATPEGRYATPLGIASRDPSLGSRGLPKDNISPQ